MAQAALTVDEYIRARPAEARACLEAVRLAVRAAAPEAIETVSYNMPSFKLNGVTLVYFAAWNKHIGLYPVHPSAWENVPGLAAFKGSKDSAHFPLQDPMPLELISAFAKFRISESRHRGV